MFRLFRKWFGGATDPPDVGQAMAPQDQRAADELAAAGLQVPADPSVVPRDSATAKAYDPDKGDYDRQQKRPERGRRPASPWS